jgi:conjugative relaxase-like TrwC/TraI family protein
LAPGPFAESDRVVLTVGKLGTTRGRLEYYDAQVAAGAEDYYAGRGESPGRWRGAGARDLGLTGDTRVERSEFMALMRGRHPLDGSVLRLMGARSTVSGFDLTFSAPKSVSVLFAIAEDDVSAALLVAHERAVDAALTYLEGEACWTRRGRDGVERVRGEGFVAASYRHRMSRAGDPQLHMHVVAGNLTCADGRFTALDGRALYEHKSAGGAVYRAVLRAEVRQRLPWLWWRESGRGLFELDGIPDPVLRHFSRRRVEIEERALELVGAGEIGELSRGRMQGITLETRRAKISGVDGGSWREQARARAAEHGLAAADIADLRTRRPQAVTGLDPARLAGRLSGPRGLTETHNSFARRHALAEIAGTFPQGAALSEVEQATSQYLADPDVVQLAGERDESRFTTADLIACERLIIDSAQRRRGEGTGTLDRRVVDRQLVEQYPALNDDQVCVVGQVTASGDGVEVVSALAGTGKTTMIAALAGVYQRAGWQVVGVAPTARAARQLRQTAGIEAQTMHALVAELGRTGGLSPTTLLVLDEAGMAPTRLSAQLFDSAEATGAKLLAVGDPGQLGSVEAGGWLATLTRDQRSSTLRQVMRQPSIREQQALEALHDGDAEPYLAFNRDAIAVHDTELGAVRELVDAWTDARDRYGPDEAVMIARDNATRERLNRGARVRLKRVGILAEPDTVIGGRGYTPGDRVIARRNDRRSDIDNGSIATIIAIDPHAGSMIVQLDSGEPRALSADYVGSHLQHAYALTAHGAQGATVQWAGVIGRPDEFRREWAYTALSRARETTTIHLIGERSEPDRERDEYAPASPDPPPTDVLRSFRAALTRTELEPLAAERLPTTPPPPRSPPAPPREPNGLDLLRCGRPGTTGRTLRL